MSGGNGIDTADYSEHDFGLNIDLKYGLSSNDDIFESIEGINGSAFDDNLHGDNNVNFINGSDGDDWISGRGSDDLLTGGMGNDVLSGGTGADLLDGGEGLDRAQYAFSKFAVTANLLDPTQNTGDAAGDTYVSIEDLAGSRHADTLIGNDDDNRLMGNSGADRLDGGKGNDVLFGGLDADVFIFNADLGQDTIMDFDAHQDHIALALTIRDGLTGSATQTVNNYASIENGNTILDFGDGNSITLLGFTDTSALIDAIDFF